MNGRKKIFWCGLLILLTSLAATAQPGKQKWIDSVFQTMNENEKIGQLFFSRLSSHSEGDLIRDLARKAESGEVGGVIFTTGTPRKQASITNRLQAEARIPLLVSQDGSSSPFLNRTWYG